MMKLVSQITHYRRFMESKGDPLDFVRARAIAVFPGAEGVEIRDQLRGLVSVTLPPDVSIALAVEKAENVSVVSPAVLDRSVPSSS